MVEGGPYRQTESEQCPVCRAPLPAREDTKPRLCLKGCGEWYSVALVRRRWGDRADQPGGVILLGKPRTERNRPEVPCAVCARPMELVLHFKWGAHRCVNHGVWLSKASRQQFVCEYSRDIEHFLAMEKRTATLTKLIYDVLDKNPDAVRALAERLATVESLVGLLAEEK